MKKFLWILLILVLLLCALFTALILFYGKNRSFAEAVDDFVRSHKPRVVQEADEVKKDDPVKETVTVTKSTEESAAGEAAVETTEEIPAGDPVNGNGLIAVPGGYTAPSESDLDIPEDLLSLTGLGNIDFTPVTVSDEEAERIEKEVPVGPTGDDLDFDPRFYPYYSFLDEQGKHLYRQMYAHINENSPSFQSVERDISEEALANVFFAVTYDHPELFWLSNGYQGKYTHNGEILELDLLFNQTASDIESARDKFESAVNSIVSAAQGSDYEKERFVHDELARRFLYRFNSLDQSAYSGLVNNQTVCAGYAKSYSRILTLLNIPCYVCVGNAGEPHAWSVVCLDGDYYNVDVTWDDTEKGRGFNYNYFNKTDADYGSSHIRQELSVYLPPCNGTKYRGLEPEEEEEAEDRAEEDTGNNDGNPTLESMGYSEDDVLRNAEDYYNLIRDRMNANGRGEYSVQIPVDDNTVHAIDNAYNSEFKARVVTPYCDENDADVSVMFDASPLAGGYWNTVTKIIVY